VPLLAQRILRHNADAVRNGGGGGGHHRHAINLVGYMVGNAVTDDEVDGNSQVRVCGGDGWLYLLRVVAGWASLVAGLGYEEWVGGTA